MTQSRQRTMQAAAIDQFGGPITPHELPVPEVGPDEILIRVESAGVAPARDARGASAGRHFVCESESDDSRGMVEEIA